MKAKPLLFDYYGSIGGTAMGYAMAGFRVVVIDNDEGRLNRCPFECEQADAIEHLLAHGHKAAVNAGSPPCWAYSRATAAVPDRFDRYPRLIAATREAMIEAGRPYVIENVRDAEKELVDPVQLCGRMFGLGAIDTDGTPLTLDRHRWFESPVPLTPPPHPAHRRGVQVAGAYGGARRDKVEARTIRKGGYVPKDVRVLQQLLGITWTTVENDLFLAVPPAYTEHVGRQLLASL